MKSPKIEISAKGEWKKIDVVSGTNTVHIDGTWTLTDTTSRTKMNLDIQGENNSDLMERFGISSGIQQASFNLWSKTEWDGAPWSMKVNSLKGDIKTELGKGVISDVSGAAKLLGLFSLDSITGSGEIENGVFVTNNINMDAVAGEMTIKGLVKGKSEA